jgi:hypothetical protein
MSKYFVDKFMRLVNQQEWAEKAYVRDPAGFVAEWEEREGQRLTDDERDALARRDYAKLYALGAHPFLLWSFTEAVWVHEVPRDELVRDYKAKTAAVGYPDFTT